MPRYVSRTGKDIVLRFKGTVITIPAYGCYESGGEDLDKLFPKHVKKLEPDEIIKEAEPKIPELHIKAISPPLPTPIEFPTFSVRSVESPKITAIYIEPTQITTLSPMVTNSVTAKLSPPIEIHDPTPINTFTHIDTTPIQFTPVEANITVLDSPKPKELNINTPTQLLLTEIKSVPLQEEFSKKITEIINNSMSNNEDLDVEEFLSMIRGIISEKND